MRTSEAPRITGFLFHTNLIHLAYPRAVGTTQNMAAIPMTSSGNDPGYVLPLLPDSRHSEKSAYWLAAIWRRLSVLLTHAVAVTCSF